MPPDDTKAPRDPLVELDELRREFYREAAIQRRRDRVRDHLYERALRRSREIEAKVDKVLELLKFTRWLWKLARYLIAAIVAVYELFHHRRVIGDALESILPK